MRRTKSPCDPVAAGEPTGLTKTQKHMKRLILTLTALLGLVGGGLRTNRARPDYLASGRAYPTGVLLSYAASGGERRDGSELCYRY